MDQNVAPSKISKIVSTLKDDDMGTFLPKTIFNINEKCRSLIDIAHRILPTCTDAEKTLHYLKQWVYFVIMLPCKLYSKSSAHPRYVYFRKDIDYYCVMHVSGEGLFAHAKGRPTEETRIQLKCSDSILQKVLQLRKDFSIHDNTKMLVMISISRQRKRQSGLSSWGRNKNQQVRQCLGLRLRQQGQRRRRRRRRRLRSHHVLINNVQWG